MIRLNPADGHERVGALCKRVGQEILELTCLVSAACQAGAIVPLDPNLRAAQMGAESSKRLHRRRKVG